MRRAAAILALALALGGCGASDEGESTAAKPAPKGDWGPTEPGPGERQRPVAPPRRAPSAAVASLLDAGTVGGVGAEGAVGGRPRPLAGSADGVLDALG